MAAHEAFIQATMDVECSRGGAPRLQRVDEASDGRFWGEDDVFHVESILHANKHDKFHSVSPQFTSHSIFPTLSNTGSKMLNSLILLQRLNC